jgi:hypothetical protein
MSKWQPIETAEKVAGKEILGSKWSWNGSRMVMVRDPFVTFWSDTQGKFQYAPTHWTESAETPDPPAESPPTEQVA